jgi:hypothetical protein
MATNFTHREIRLWAMVMAGALTVVGLVQLLVWDHRTAATVLWIIAAAFFLPGLMVPAALKPLYGLWMKFAMVLAWVNTRIILSLTYFLVFTPIGLILKLLGKDLIKEKWDPKATTYWIERERTPFDPSRYEKQY